MTETTTVLVPDWVGFLALAGSFALGYWRGKRTHKRITKAEEREVMDSWKWWD